MNKTLLLLRRNNKALLWRTGINQINYVSLGRLWGRIARTEGEERTVYNVCDYCVIR